MYTVNFDHLIRALSPSHHQRCCHEHWHTFASITRVYHELFGIQMPMQQMRTAIEQLRDMNALEYRVDDGARPANRVQFRMLPAHVEEWHTTHRHNVML